MSLDDLVALNDEISALVRAGVPIELGLSSWSRGVRGRLGRIASRLARNAERGQSLSEALSDPGIAIPQVYRAIVVSGLKSGHLPAALESLSATARRLQQVRDSVGLALLYPLLLLLLAYALFLFLAGFLIPALVAVFEAPAPRLWEAMAHVGAWARTSTSLGDTSIPLALLPPLVLVACLLIWWLTTRRAIMVDARQASWLLIGLPTARRMAHDARSACLAEMLGLLIDHDIPSDEAVRLAAQCTGDQRLIASADGLSESLRRGERAGAEELEHHGFPPLLAWLLSTSGDQQTFSAMARHIADVHRRRIARDAQWVRDYLPIGLTAAVGGCLVLLFSLATFVPFTHIMESLSTVAGQSMRIKP